MLKQSAISVLASFRSSTYHLGYVEAIHSLRPSWTACLSILRERSLLFQMCHNSFPWSVGVLALGASNRLRLPI